MPDEAIRRLLDHDRRRYWLVNDVDGSRLLGFQTYVHRHRFRRAGEPAAYDFRGADELICDFFAAVEQACRQEGTPFEFEAEERRVGDRRRR